jgi:hypothetical protein
MQEFDLFTLFRTLLFVALTTYTVLATVSGLRRVVGLLRGRDPRKRLLRAYLGYQLVSLRLRPLAGELLQIAFWVTMLVCLWWLHTQVH